MQRVLISVDRRKYVYIATEMMIIIVVVIFIIIIIIIIRVILIHCQRPPYSGSPVTEWRCPSVCLSVCLSSSGP